MTPWAMYSQHPSHAGAFVCSSSSPSWPAVGVTVQYNDKGVRGTAAMIITWAMLCKVKKLQRLARTLQAVGR